MDYSEVLIQARKIDGFRCHACSLCDGRACGSRMPGPGAAGTADTAFRNYDKWKEVRLNMDTIREIREPDTSLELFGRRFALPVFAAPIAGISAHYGGGLKDRDYIESIVSACAVWGTAAFTGDGPDPDNMLAALEAVKAFGGTGVPTVKPWGNALLTEKLSLIRASGAFAAAMDIDTAAFPFVKEPGEASGGKTPGQLAEAVQNAGVPFILKGIMTEKGADKAVAAGAAGIVVSNHGGRVLDQCPATAEVLEKIAKRVKGKTKIFVDGGIRTGTDVFKALALGADAVLIGRPFVTAFAGAGKEGISCYLEKVAGELRQAMKLCGADTLQEINRDMIMSCL